MFKLTNESHWLQEFLRRAEYSVLATSSRISDEEREFVQNLLSSFSGAELWCSFLMSPHVSTYFNQFEIENNDQILRLEDITSFNYEPLLIDGHSLSIWTKPHPIYKKILNNIGIGSLGKSSKNADFLGDLDSYYLHSSRIKAALDLMKKCSRPYYDEVTFYLRQASFVNRKASFRASTTYHARGMTFFSPLESWHSYTWFEELIHEATHNFVFSLITFDELLIGENAYELKIRGPLRSDLRHHFGNFQALLVIARIINAYQTADGGRDFEEHAADRIEFFLSNTKDQFLLMKEEVEFSEIGKIMFENELVPTFS